MSGFATKNAGKHEFYTQVTYIVSPEEIREETGHSLCLGLVTKLYKARSKQSSDFQLSLQLHVATGAGLWRTQPWVSGRFGMEECRCHLTLAIRAAAEGMWLPTRSAEGSRLLQESNVELLLLTAPFSWRSSQELCGLHEQTRTTEVVRVLLRRDVNSFWAEGCSPGDCCSWLLGRAELGCRLGRGGLQPSQSSAQWYRRL